MRVYRYLSVRGESTASDSSWKNNKACASSLLGWRTSAVPLSAPIQKRSGVTMIPGGVFLPGRGSSSEDVCAFKRAKMNCRSQTSTCPSLLTSASRAGSVLASICETRVCKSKTLTQWSPLISPQQTGAEKGIHTALIATLEATAQTNNTLTRISNPLFNICIIELRLSTHTRMNHLNSHFYYTTMSKGFV